MAKKKVMTPLEKFEIIKKKLCEHRGEKYDNNSKKCFTLSALILPNISLSYP
jgi:hypothetical protein